MFQAIMGVGLVSFFGAIAFALFGISLTSVFVFLSERIGYIGALVVIYGSPIMLLYVWAIFSDRKKIFKLIKRNHTHKRLGLRPLKNIP